MEKLNFLDLVKAITQLTKQINENVESSSIYYDKFNEIYQFNQEIIDHNKLVGFLFLKLNSYVSIKYSSYLNDNQIKTSFKISGLITLLKHGQDVNLNVINDILKMDFSLLKEESHLDLIKILKIIFKNSLLNNIQVDLKKQLTDNTMEYFKKSIKSFVTSNYSKIYLANKLIKCISIVLNTKQSNEYNRVIFNYLNTQSIILNENLYTGYQFFYAKLMTFTIGLILKIKEEHDKINLKELDIIYIQLDDDVLIDFNLKCLETQILSNENSSLFVFDLNAHVLFVKLMACISFDYEVVINWLIENQTNFLLYIVKYLKYLSNETNQFKLLNIQKIFSTQNDMKFMNFQQILINEKADSIIKRKKHNRFNESCIGETYLKKAFNLLCELKFKILKTNKNFGYNVKPLIKLLNNVTNIE